MAKDFVSALGVGELNALMSMQVQKLEGVTKNLAQLFTDNDQKDFSRAYQKGAGSDEFVRRRDMLLDELSGVVDTMDKIRVAQKSLNKKEQYAINKGANSRPLVLFCGHIKGYVLFWRRMRQAKHYNELLQ